MSTSAKLWLSFTFWYNPQLGAQHPYTISFIATIRGHVRSRGGHFFVCRRSSIVTRNCRIWNGRMWEEISVCSRDHQNDSWEEINLSMQFWFVIISTHWGRDKIVTISQTTVWNARISIKILLKIVPKGPINNIPTLVQIMVWHWPGDKPLS